MIRRVPPLVGVLVSISLTLAACASPLAPSADPDNFYEAVRSDVEKFWTGYFSSQLGRTYTPITRMELFNEQASSRCTGFSIAFYCSPDGGVYLSTAFMESQLARFGKFGPAMIIAHEIGHHTQNLLGLLNVRSIFRELQADCVAGGWMKDAGARGLLEVGDYQEAANNLFTLGDPVGTPWFAPDAHGTSQERRDAFTIGYLYGASSCSW